MPSDSSRRGPPAKIGSGRFELEKKIDAGCFAEVFRALDTQTGERVAVKCEECKTPPQLEHGSEILKELSRPKPQQGFVETFYFGREGLYNCLVMELLGHSLESRVQRSGGKFSVKSTILVCQQVLHRIEYLHSKCIVHRDIKPENFMFGLRSKIHHVYLIDFGLSKKYWDKKHIPQRQKLSLTGTARYVSINAHKGLEQSRRDDMESIGHMFMYLVRGMLPWSGLDAKTKQEKYRKIMEKKEQTPLAELCAGYPSCFEEYLRYSRKMQFPERPDYDKLQELFKQARRKEGPQDDADYEWFEGRPPTGPLEALRPRDRMQQPDDPHRRRSATGCSACGGCFAFLRR